MRISKEFRFEAAHRLRYHQGACRNIHGHSYKLVVDIEGPLQNSGPAAGMVIDFDTLSQVVRSVLHGDDGTVPFDHSIMLHEDDDVCTALEEVAEHIDFELRIKKLLCEPTAENLAELFSALISLKLEAACEDLDERPRVLMIEVWETEKAVAVWEAE